MSIINWCATLARPWSVAMALLVAGPGDSAAQAPALDTLRLAEALRIAREDNPALGAARSSALVAGERVSQAGALPDPRLTLGLANRPLTGFGTAEPMTMNRLEVTQSLPWPGKLGFSRERAAHLARAGTLDADEAGLQLARGVTETYYELAFVDRGLLIMERTRDLLRDFFQVSRSRYATGAGLQQDVLQAQVAVARMTEDITVAEQQRVALAARLNALLGREATAPVGALALPAPGGALPPAGELLATAVRERPALAAAAERVNAAQAGYRAARRALYPDFMVTVGYGQRPQFDDMVSVMVGISVPLWAGSRQLPLRREMAAMQEGEEAMARNLHNETFAQLTEARAEAERARTLHALYETAIIPQARAAVESALSAYRVGQVDFMTLIENEMTVNRYETESVRLAASWQQATARIRALLGREGDIE